MCNYNICNTTRNLIKSLCLLLLVGCGDLPDEGTLRRQGTSVTINYNHSDSLRDFEMKNYSSSVQRMIANTWPIRHNIKVEPDIADIDLDEDLRAEVEVPVDEPMYVVYSNWTQEQPEIIYQYGKSEEFIVTWDDEYIVKVWVDVDINPDYPFPEEETEEETEEEENEEEQTDNETEETDNETEVEVIDTTLLAHYKFEDDLTDNSSYGRHLELCPNSNPNWIFVDETLMNELPSGKAAWFSGEECAENEFRDNGTSPLGISDDWTISFWIVPYLSNQNFDTYHSVMSTGDATSGGRFQIDHSGQEELRFMGALKVDLEEEWMFFTYTKSTGTIDTSDNQKVRVYLDGEFNGYAYPLSTLWDKLKIGMNRLGGGGWYGLIDDFRVYNRPLTADEVEELYESYDEVQ